MKIILTGGSGDLGTVLTPKLEAHGDTHGAAFTLQVYGHFQPRGNKSEVDKLDTTFPATERQKNKKVG
ncbi:MAG: NAD(P)-dependent oxidoreductase [Deltaproteobacteria bacterium]|nr:NAD(P)-dependent oxidoreductase [Deltaproteobacteria bacterium]